MLYPKPDELVSKVDSRFTLVIMAAKRTRQINEYFNNLHKETFTHGEGPLVKIASNNPLSIALEEIREGKVTYSRVKDGIK
ncbi:MAG: DNA-directed RNA polymerase subunit omega [Actinobacteria bacterium]|nr:DNA-directed RNA polymerase subunit omega [Actinomycetota bacterium]